MIVYALIFVVTIGPGSFSETLALYTTEKACIDAGYYLAPGTTMAKLECRRMLVMEKHSMQRREMGP